MSIYKPNGSPYFHYDFQVGRSRFHGSTKSKNRREATAIERDVKEKVAEEARQRAKTGRQPMTFDQAAGRYWEEKAKYLKNPDKHFATIKRLVDFFGKEKRLEEIDDAAVMEIVAHRRKQPRWGKTKLKTGTVRPVTGGTINREVLEPLRAILRHAKELWRQPLPLEPRWRKHFLKEPKERVRELRDGERVALDAAMRDDFMPWYLFSHVTGRRMSETLIRWADINEDAGEITTPGKGDTIVRTPLTPFIRELLEPLKGHHPVYVFTFVAQRTLPKKGYIKGRRYPIVRSHASIRWRRCRIEAGVVDFRFHDHRHDRATKLLRQTRNLKLVQLALNHANISTTAKYAHVMNEDLAAALEESAKSRNLSRSESPPES
jgi:integrase